jgi:hypothetical protein
MALDEGDGARACDEAEIARERALCDGPPYCYSTALHEAEAILDEISSKLE